MEGMFDASHNKFTVKFYEALNLSSEEHYLRSETYLFSILIRHTEDSNAEELFDAALKKMYPVKEKKCKQIYQVIGFVNAFNKRTRRWENQHSFSQLYIGKAGYESALYDFDKQKNEVQFYRTCNNHNKYNDIRGKAELHTPHVHDNGQFANWGDKVIKSFNPDNI